MGFNSTYNGFDVKIRNADRTETPVPDAIVKIYDASSMAELGEALADGSGFVASGSVDVPVGTVLRFRIENHHGMSGYAEDVTVENP